MTVYSYSKDIPPEAFKGIRSLVKLCIEPFHVRRAGFHDANPCVCHSSCCQYAYFCTSRASKLSTAFALRFARRETDTNAKRKQNRAKRDTSSIHAHVVYAEHCARRGALSKANQAVTSNSMPNANPCNIDLRAKHPEPAHPGRDPVSLSSQLWPRPQN